MFLSHSGWLCVILPTLIAAKPQKTAPARPKRSLPPILEQQVPACAQPCLRTSLSELFPFACTIPTDLNCLCSRYSFNGQTLGEVAVGCIYASCSTYHGATSAYNVCLGERYAVAPTLTVLTVVPRTSSTSRLSSMAITSSRPATITTTQIISTTASTPRPPQTSQTDTVIADSVPLISSPTSTASQGTTTPLAAADPPKTMTPAQIAGLAVAVGAAFVIAIGLMGLTIFLRRRKERREIIEVDEKGTIAPSPSDYPPRYSRSFALETGPSSRILLPPPPVKTRSPSPRNFGGGDPGLKPFRLSTVRHVGSHAKQPDASIETNQTSHLPRPRPEQETLNNASGTSIPLEQIGLAITVEQPRASTDRNELEFHPPLKEAQRPTMTRRNADTSQRPDSVMTQTTLFEEDDVRRESKLLPALPQIPAVPQIPVPPIRSFQPSRPQPTASPIQAAMERSTIRQIPPQSELFLDIPTRYSRSQPSNANTSDPPSYGTQSSARTLKNQSTSHTGSSENNPMSADSEVSQVGDIPDYYFTAYQEPKAIHSVSPSNLGKAFWSRQEPSRRNAKSKLPSSNISRATSRASTNIRDSFSSQTSFETVDPDDPTPEDDGNDRKIASGKLSPVAESPIHKLRYPKVPRTSNQLVPRSPKSPQSQMSQSSLSWQSQPSSLLVKRKGEQGALSLGNPFRTGSPDARATSEIRRYRQHLRSSSVETFSPVRSSERSTRTQSSLWPKSPILFDGSPTVRPLTIRKTQLLQTSTEDMQALKSPIWVPRLTPTRQGDDLFINVTYSKPGR